MSHSSFNAGKDTSLPLALGTQALNLLIRNASLHSILLLVQTTEFEEPSILNVATTPDSSHLMLLHII